MLFKGGYLIMDQLNRQRTYQNSRVPHVAKTKKKPLEENNTVVVSHKQKSFTQKLKELFKRT